MTENEILLNSIAAYNEAGKCSYNYTEHNKPGIYFIIEDNIIVYVGMSFKSAYKALYRHFQTWNDKRNKNYRATYSKLNTKVFIKCLDQEITPSEESKFINMCLPRDNKEYYRHTRKFDNRNMGLSINTSDVPF